jgi:predicted RND superfamily exporter protein
MSDARGSNGFPARVMGVLVEHPFAALIVAVTVAAALGSFVPRLRTDVSPTTLMIAGDEQLPVYEEAKRQFGSDDLTIVVVKADDIFSPGPLRTIELLSDELFGLEGVVRVDSLSTVNDVKGDDEWLTTDRLMRDGVPEDETGLEALRSDALANPLISANLVSPDTRAAGILVYTEPDAGDSGFDERFSDRVDELVAAAASESGLEVYQIGRPYTQALLGRTILHDQTRIVPYAVVVIAVILALTFRGLHVVVVSGTARVLSIVWAMGLMAVLDYPVTLLTALIPLLLIIVGFTEDVHFVSEYYEKLREGLAKRDAIRAAGEQISTPLLVTSFTTAVGFASLSLSDIVILGQLGRVAALAFTSSYFVTLLVVPALLWFWPGTGRRFALAEADQESDRLGVVLRGLGGFVVSHRRAIFIGAAVVFAAGAAGTAAIRVDNDAVGFFRPDSELRKRIDDVDAVLTGSSMFYVTVDVAEGGNAAASAVQRQVAELQSEIDAIPGVSRTISAADYIRLVHREMNGGADEMFVVPDSDELIAQYLVLLHPADLEKQLSYDRRSTAIIVRHNVNDTKRFAALLDRIRGLAGRTLSPSLRFNTTSEGILQARAADRLAVGMATGMAYTIAIVAVVCSLFFLSLRVGLLSLIPNLLPIAVVFGVMGVLDVPLSAGTAMIATVAIGIAVDDTVHYMARNSMELDFRHDPVEAMQYTLASEGRAIVATSIALACGFLVLLASSFVPLMYLGALASLVMVVALACDLTLTPALLTSTSLVTLWNLVGMKLDGDVVEKVPLFRGFSRWEARKIVSLGRLTMAESGRTLIREGDPDDGVMYVLLSGRLKVESGDGSSRTTLADLSAGDLFGEVAAADRGRRSADVIAEEDCEVLELSTEDLERISRRFPRTALKLFGNLSRILSGRLRATTRAAVGAA